MSNGDSSDHRLIPVVLGSTNGQVEVHGKRLKLWDIRFATDDHRGAIIGGSGHWLRSVKVDSDLPVTGGKSWIIPVRLPGWIERPVFPPTPRHRFQPSFCRRHRPC